MGLGYALSEEVIFSNGKPLNDSFLDYRLPTMMDVPEIVPVIVEKERARSPEDIRGIGEPATIPTATTTARPIRNAWSGKPRLSAGRAPGSSICVTTSRGCGAAAGGPAGSDHPQFMQN